jgi:hypothetical protein
MVRKVGYIHQMGRSLLTGINNLKRKYEELKKEAFPHYPVNENLDEVFCQLEIYDSGVAGLVSTFLKTGIIKKELVNIYDLDSLFEKYKEIFPVNEDLSKLIERKGKVDNLYKLLMKITEIK